MDTDINGQNSSGDKSDTVSINVETGCSFPGGNCLVVGSEETRRTDDAPHGQHPPYNANWRFVAWIRTYLARRSSPHILDLEI